MTWDPWTYLAFGGERIRAAAELLSRISVNSPARVADLGCGPGNSTALLAARWPEASIDAIDNSPTMLAEARETPTVATWIEADVAQWTPDAAFDVIYSNATLHWVASHETLLPRLVSFLAPRGVLAFQVPRNFREPSHQIAEDLAGKPRWSVKLSRARTWWHVLEPEAYYQILEQFADPIDIWESRYLQRLEGPDAVCRWVMGTGLRPYLDALQGEEREAFLDEYRRRVALAYPERANGITLFPFQRLFCVATRKA